MAGKKDGEGERAGGERQGRAKGAKLQPVRWFNPGPNSTDEAWLESHDDRLVDLVFALFEAVPADGRLTVKFDSGSGRWTAILFVRADSAEFELDAMSVRSAAAIDAVFLLAYFHLVKFETGWSGMGAKREGRWG